MGSDSMESITEFVERVTARLEYPKDGPFNRFIDKLTDVEARQDLVAALVHIRDLAGKLERAEEQRDTAWIDADVEVTRILEAFREACEHVHATANGNTDGLTVDEQLQALRSAAKMCSAALALGREIGKP